MFIFLTGLLAGCSGGANYTLHLNPVVATLQTPFEGVDRLDLVLSSGNGDEPFRVEIDSPASGSTPKVKNLPALADTRISVEGFLDDKLIFRGMTEPLTATTGDVETDVFIASTEKVAWLGPLTDGLYLPMLTALGEGRFWLAGGVTNDRGGAPNRGHKGMLTLTLAPPGEALAFTSIGDLPPYQTHDGATENTRMGAGFTPLTVKGPDQGKILVTGGAPNDVWRGGEASKSASLYDPTTDTWEDIPGAGAMREPRVQHLVLENTLGNVVVWGGYGAHGTGGSVALNTTLEYYNAANRSFSSTGFTNDIGSIDAMMADLGADGTLLCGGTLLVDEGAAWSSSDTCVRVKLDGSSFESFARLPDGLTAAAMVALPDGSVLATGGASANPPVDALANVDASDSAWLYSPSSLRWTKLSERMPVGRVGHRMVVMADGRVLIAGGTKTYNANIVPTDPVRCLDLYDPAAGTFAPVDGCEDGDETGGLLGGAYGAQAAYDPDYGVLIVGGMSADGSADQNVALFVPEL